MPRHCLAMLLAAAFARGTQAQTPRTERYAVLVGASEYPDSIPSLQGGPLNDVALMRELLVKQFGFSTTRILTLTNTAATRARMIDAIRGHLGKAGPNDVALFYFSGHGIQVDATQGLSGDLDPEPDGFDEALLVWADSGRRATYILDDELGVLLDELRARRVVAIIDACHAGSASRGAPDATIQWSDFGGEAPPAGLVDDRYRSAHLDAKRVLRSDAWSAIDAPTKWLTDAPLPPRRDHLLLAAALDDQSALTGTIHFSNGGKKPMSFFTAALYQTLRRASPSVTVNTIIARVDSVVARITRDMPDARQTPTATGMMGDQSLETLFLLPRMRTRGFRN